MDISRNMGITHGSTHENTGNMVILRNMDIPGISIIIFQGGFFE